MRRGLCYLHLSQIESAEADFTSLLDLLKQDKVNTEHRIKQQQEQQSGVIDGSSSDQVSLRQINSNIGLMYNLLGKCMLKKELWSESVDKNTLAITMAPHLLGPYRDRSQAYHQLGFLTLAEQDENTFRTLYTQKQQLMQQ